MQRVALIKFAGGQSAKPRPEGHELKYAPRWSPSAAAATSRILHEAAQRADQQRVIFLTEALTTESTWSIMMKALKPPQGLTVIQAGVAIPILEFHRPRFCALAAADRPAQAESILRSMRKRAQDCPELESMDIPPAPGLEPKSFLELIQGAAEKPVRATPEAKRGEGPLRFFKEWGLDRLDHQGVIVIARAGSRVREWRNKHNTAKDAMPELALAKAIVHGTILPTLTANVQDQWWLTGPQRYMSVPEACRCMGLRDKSPLTRALCGLKYPSHAMQMLGKAIHAGVASVIVGWLDSQGLLPLWLTYASACSGIDTFAEAVDVHRPGGMWKYVHAAELRAEPLNIIGSAWAVPRARLLTDAADTASAPPCDLYMLSPDCHDFSKRRHGRDGKTVAAGAVETWNVSPFVAAGRAAVVVIENVDETDGADAITTVVASYPMYSWQSQQLGAEEHAGVPVRRDRRFWVGVRHGLVRRSLQLAAA